MGLYPEDLVDYAFATIVWALAALAVIGVVAVAVVAWRAW